MIVWVELSSDDANTLVRIEQEGCEIDIHSTWSVHNKEVIQSHVFTPLKYFASSVLAAGYKTDLYLMRFLLMMCET